MTQLLDNTQNLKLPFNKRMQRGLLGHLLSNEKFFKLARMQILPEWFTEEIITGRIYAIQLKLFDRFGKCPKLEEVKACTDVMSEPMAEQRKICAHVETCVQDTKEFSLEFLSEQLTDWLIAVTFANTIKNAEMEYNRQNFDRVANIFRDIAKKTTTLRFNEVPSESFDDWEADFKQAVLDRDTALTTGLQCMDRALLEGATKGGLVRGDTTVLLAPSNAGKTTAMVTMAVANILQHKRVLFITHEGRKADIKEKIWQGLLRVTKPELLELYKTDEGLKRIKLANQFLKRYLTYIPFNKPGMVVEEVEPLIRRAHEEMAAKHGGKGFDLVIDDYPAKLSTTKAVKGNMARREIDRCVYDYFVQLALENNFHCLVAIQSNREGSKINNGKEDRLLVKEDVAEAWGVIEMATNVITLTRSPQAKAKNRLTFLVDKSRGSETGIAICVRSRYDWSLTHAEDFGSVWYKSQQTFEDKMDSFLQQLSNSEKGFHNVIPEHLTRG